MQRSITALSTGREKSSRLRTERVAVSGWSTVAKSMCPPCWSSVVSRRSVIVNRRLTTDDRRQAARYARMLQRSRSRRCPRLGGLTRRQPDRECRALAGLAGDVDAAVVGADQRLRDEEAEPHAFARLALGAAPRRWEGRSQL